MSETPLNFSKFPSPTMTSVGACLTPKQATRSGLSLAIFFSKEKPALSSSAIASLQFGQVGVMKR